MKDKYCSSVRVPLPALFVTAALVLNTTAIAQAPSLTLWYNGDWNFVKGLPNERNTLVTQAAVYDDFNVTGGGWLVQSVFSDNLMTPGEVITGADWEIRTGISAGNAGTLVAGGITSAPVVTLTGRSAFGYLEYMVQVNGLNVTLAPGHYWLNVTPIDSGTGRSFNSTTSGVNCVGTPCGNNDNAFFNSTYFGAKFRNTNNAYGQPDFSMGVVGFGQISSARFKTNIRSMGDSSEVVLALHPVTFEYKPELDPAGTHQFGLVAEEVEKVNPDLITRDAQGKPYAVRYEAVNTMLLNEFLKEHRKMEEQEAAISQLRSTVGKQEATIMQERKDFQSKLADQQKQIKALTSGLEKVSEQLELNKPASQMLNNQ